MEIVYYNGAHRRCLHTSSQSYGPVNNNYILLPHSDKAQTEIFSVTV